MRSFRLGAFCGILLLSFLPAFAEGGNEEEALLEKILLENIIPFWHPSTIDHSNGGYRMNHDLKGQWKGDSVKGIVTQARSVWFYSRLLRSKYTRPEFLTAAKHGYEFLRDRMWDRTFGGFYWSVDPTGQTPVQADKHLYGQAFGLYALSEYASATGDKEALDLARRLFQLLERFSYDRRYGGYREFFLRDWRLPPSGTRGYMGVEPHIKLMNTHLHILEALTAYYLATHDPVARERLIELIHIQSNSVVRKSVGACTDKYLSNWEPLGGPEFEVVSYGHDIENIWLLMEACDAAGVHQGPFLDLFVTLFNYSTTFGYDLKSGGFFDRGPFYRPATRTDKIWWVQSEGLISALRLFHSTQSKRYYQFFQGTLGWIAKNQVDWEDGEWFATVDSQGSVSGDKAGLWKSPYHNGRAVLECLELLQSPQ